MSLRLVLLTCSLATASAGGSVEVLSGDLSSRKAFGNVKGSYSAKVKLLGSAATLSTAYDLKAKKDFLKEISLKGSIDRVRYSLVSKFGPALDLALSTNPSKGLTIAAAGKVSPFKGDVSKVSADYETILGGQDVSFQLTHQIPSATSKLGLEVALGDTGVTAVGALTSAGRKYSTAYSFEYDTEITPGRTLSACVSPTDGSGEVELIDTTTMDATITAMYPFGGRPRLTVKRAFKF